MIDAGIRTSAESTRSNARDNPGNACIAGDRGTTELPERAVTWLVGAALE